MFGGVKLLDRLADVAKRRHMSPLTVECYQRWVREFLVYCAQGPLPTSGAQEDPLDVFLMVNASAAAPRRWRHPRELGAADVGRFLTYLAKDRQLSASSQNQATNAIVFLYKQVLGDELPADHLGKFAGERSKRPKRVPTVLSEEEVRRIIEQMPAESTRTLMTQLLYGTGLRVMECCTLRVGDMDLDRGQIIVRGGKGDQDRVVMLPASVRGRLVEHLRAVRRRAPRRQGEFLRQPFGSRGCVKSEIQTTKWRRPAIIPSLELWV